MLGKGIIVGIATGNGDYIQDELKKYFHKKHHPNVFIGYFHCGFISSLNRSNASFIKSTCFPMDFKLIKEFFFENKLYEHIVSEGFESNNPFELNFFSEEGEKGKQALHTMKKYIEAHTSLKILDSPHSFDVIPRWNSKADLCKYLEYQFGFSQSEILTIGDCGAEGQSDYELLCREDSLSVNTVSKALNSCWKFTKKDCTNLSATWEYIRSIRLETNTFRIFNYE
jgi:hydroxymethylpyrimidine pyrophosphatase-like HAD family hydrolase